MAGPNLVELLAQLDCLVDVPKSRSLNEKERNGLKREVLKILAGKLANKFTVAQIEETLWKEFHGGYTYAQLNFPLLFLHGSSEMLKLDQNTRDLVKARAGEIRMHMSFSTPRSRRSQSAFPTPASKRHRRARSAESNARTPSRKKAPRKPNKPKAKQQGQIGHELKSREPSRSRAIRSATAIPSTEIIDETPLQSPSSSLPEDYGTPSPHMTAQMTQNLLTVPKIHAKDGSHGGPQNSGTNGDSCNSSFIAESYKDLVSEIAHYKALYEHALHDKEALEKTARQVRGILAETQGIPERLAAQLHANVLKVVKLKQQAGRAEGLEHYLARSHINAEAPTPTNKKVQFDFEVMKVEFNSINVINGAQKPSIDTSGAQSDDLDFLLCTVFNAKPNADTKKVLESSQTMILQDLVRALTGAAIHKWVFESGYHSIGMTNTPLLQEYRKHIATWWGDDNLANLDTAVHQSMIGEKHFNNVTIPRMAHKQTSRLLDALQHLFNEEERDITTTKLRGPLDRVFTLALKSTWPSPGSAFDDQKLQKAEAGTSVASSLVRLPICPGLQAYEKTSEMVRYDGFASGGVAGVPKYVIRAMVLV